MWLGRGVCIDLHEGSEKRLAAENREGEGKKENENTEKRGCYSDTREWETSRGGGEGRIKRKTASRQKNVPGKM
jgi:hypothetical protein